MIEKILKLVELRSEQRRLYESGNLHDTSASFHVQEKADKLETRLKSDWSNLEHKIDTMQDKIHALETAVYRLSRGSNPDL